MLGSFRIWWMRIPLVAQRMISYGLDVCIMFCKRLALYGVEGSLTRMVCVCTQHYFIYISILHERCCMSFLKRFRVACLYPDTSAGSVVHDPSSHSRRQNRVPMHVAAPSLIISALHTHRSLLMWLLDAQTWQCHHNLFRNGVCFRILCHE